MHIHLGGHLAFYHRQTQSWFEYQLIVAAPLTQVLDQLGVPTGEIMLTVVNNEVVDLKTSVVNDQDTVQLYPPSNGG